LKALAWWFSPVSSKSYFLIYVQQKKNNYTLLEFNQRVFVYEDGNWAAKGRYETALEDNDDILWTFDELNTLHLLTSTQAASSLPSCSSSHFSHMSATKSSFASGTKEKEAILTILGIPSHLCNHSDHSPQISYKKYKAYLEACHTYDQLVSDGSWLGNKLTAVNLVELFVSKSFWHSHVKKYCSQVSNHPLMVEWLKSIDPLTLRCGVYRSPITLRT
jgi:hypothetical protein